MIKGNLYRGEERIDFTIPEKWEEVKLKHLEAINEDTDSLTMFSVLSGIDLDIVKQCKAKEVSFIVSQIQGLFNYEELSNQSELVETVNLNGKTYKITTDLLSMPSGQWWDIKKLEQMYQDKPVESIRHILSALFIEEGKHYDYSNVKETYEALSELDVLTAFKIRSFFLSSQVLYLVDSQNSLKRNTTLKSLRQVMTRLVVSTVLYLPSMVWHKIKRLLARFLERRKK